MSIISHPSSFKDPENRVFRDHNNKIIRLFFKPSATEEICRKNIHLELMEKGLVIPFEALSDEELSKYKTEIPSAQWGLKPEEIPVIIQPEQWVFSQWKEAALNLLNTNLELLKKNYILKDAPVFNFCFHKGKMQLMDLGSFDYYSEGLPWKAYGQFCRHFLYPLWLMVFKDISFKKFFHAFPDGFPEDFVMSQFHFFKRFSVPFFLHLVLPARQNKKYHSLQKLPEVNISKKNIEHILHHLKEHVASLNLKQKKHHWINYYSEIKHYNKHDLDIKSTFIRNHIQKLPKGITLLDLGSNTGEFSLMLSDFASLIVTVDADHDALEYLYEKIKKMNLRKVIPVHDSFSYPLPNYGWNLSERINFISFKKFDLTLFLALYHHVRIADSIPADKIFLKLKELTNFLFIEYISPEDPMLKKINLTRQMNLETYEFEFHKNLYDHFNVLDKTELTNSRIIYFCQAKTDGTA
ncbi:MAG: class I SAM-dependent methyltransferase [Bacteroidia bacterium]|nr:class I SAM-dependent methyltransferase [Bacteroidia bacterium]